VGSLQLSYIVVTAGSKGVVDLTSQIIFDNCLNLTAFGVHDAADTKVQLRLVELEQLVQQVDGFFFLGVVLPISHIYDSTLILVSIFYTR